MFLRKIIAQGFKSFADKVTLTLDQRNITGIVGPNGSGKSNVIDAVRWVMGEQNSKMLRGEVATDIIFSGSEKRKPLAMAEVTLVFDNRTYSAFCPVEYQGEDEIALTRRLYIDGQREYLINRRPVRLKDIAQFFAATGLGGRSYSMIQQGQVDRILQAKPEQLREILEEAAGVHIYKQRRHDADRKLQDTDTNLERIEDLVNEITTQMATLEKQANEAKRYKSLSHLIRSTEIELMSQNYATFVNKRKQLSTAREEALLKEAALQVEVEQLESKQKSIKEELEATDPELNALTEQITTLREQVAGTEAQLSTKSSILASNKENLATQTTELTQLQTQTVEYEQQIHKAREQFEQAVEEADILESQIEFFAEEKESTAEQVLILEQKIEEYQLELRAYEKKRDMSRMERQSLEKEFAETKRSMNEHTEVVTELEQHLSEHKILLDGMLLKENKLQANMDRVAADKQKIEVNLSQTQYKVEKLQATHTQKREALLATETKLGLLTSYEEKHQNDLRTFCTALPAHLQSQACYLIDHFRFHASANGLDKALLLSIESWLDRLAISSEQYIHEITLELSKHQMSGIHATLTTGAQEEVPHIPGLQPLSSFLEIIHNTNPHDLPIQDTLCGIFVAPAPLHDELIHNLPQTVQTVFFADGSVYSPKSKQLVLGTPQGAKGSLTRKQEIETLTEVSAQHKLEIERLNLQLSKHQEQLKIFEDQLHEIHQQGKSIQEQVYEIKTEVRASEQESLYKRNELERLQSQFAAQSASYETYASKLETIRQTLKNSDTCIEKNSAAIIELQTDLEDCKGRHDEAQTQWEERRLDVQTLKTRAETLREHFERDTVGQQEQIQRLEQKKSQTHKLELQTKEIENEVASLSVTLQSLLESRAACEEQLAQMRANSSETLQQLRELETQIREAQKMARECKSTSTELGLEDERVQFALSNIHTQALEKYSLVIEETTPKEIENYDAQQAGRQVSQYKKELQSLGDVNMTAIDAYEELAKRNDFIEQQRSEVLEAKEKLLLAIDEIEESTKEKFLEMFHTLNMEFSGLFPILFPRGEGSLHLTDEEDPLHSGVEIYVRLPGKKRQNMRLFSGGEKALTAIALIFALLKSKPTPFCFLDEVDAPLDETNVKRYNNVLEALADRFQFIVITHRRRTMEVLDTLFGVTMQEPGVSKVVGVDMNKSLPSHLQKSFKEKSSSTHATLN
ncbi:MAG: chromosome segregation protein SMC [Zetaproteobacteria bacterium]|nr:chromosome segregation protein SMC [Zetaproteobacteria bacterium]